MTMNRRSELITKEFLRDEMLMRLRWEVRMQR